MKAWKIGRAAGRGRVEISGVAGSLKREVIRNGDSRVTWR